MMKPLQQLKQPRFKWVGLRPVKFRQVSLEALKLPLNSLKSRKHGAFSFPYLSAASGLVFTGVLAAQFVPLPGFSLTRPGGTAFEDSLWQSAGAMRQSMVGLYRAERVLLPLSPEGAKPAVGAKPGTGAIAKAGTGAITKAGNGAIAKPKPQAPSLQGGRATPAAPAPRIAQAPTAPPAARPKRAAVNPGSTIDTNLEMRVAVSLDASALDVGVSAEGYLMDLEGQHHCNVPAQSSYTARPTGQGIDFGNCQLSTAVWLEAGEGGYVYVDGSWFKGRVLLLNDGGTLTAINFVLLHDYLSSVVGSEMYVSWPIEALKAQAVAARSYALTHHVRPASRNYDLDNTQRFQAYKGIAEETNTTQIAVNETSGEFISYNGGIVESLYAASDQIVQEAHGGQGMSQTGAMQLATQGYDYSQILATYYPGTGLARLVVK